MSMKVLNDNLSFRTLLPFILISARVIAFQSNKQNCSRNIKNNELMGYAKSNSLLLSPHNPNTSVRSIISVASG